MQFMADFDMRDDQVRKVFKKLLFSLKVVQ